MKVRTNSKYVFQPCGWDRVDPPHGVKTGILKPGDVVKVVALPGCPKPNVMGHCHIETEAGDFAGLVNTNSLEKRAK